MFFQQLVNGIIIGSAYALISIGLTMSFGIMHFSNFAHGTIYMLGGYAMYFFSMYVGMPFFLAVALSIVTIGLLGILFDRFVFRSVYGGPHLRDILISTGLLIFLENMALLLWGSETLSVRSPYTDTVISIFSAALTVQRLIVLIASLVLIGALYVFLDYSRIGKAIMATAQNPVGASLVGIDRSLIYMLTFAISSGLAAAGGALLAPLFYVYPTMGSMPLIKAFVVVVLGGLGNVQGAVVGGFIVGIVESLGGGYISSDYKNAFPFIILVAVLLIRPQGIFGRRSTGE
jgi:branched-chain amino acid transport system permease protein